MENQKSPAIDGIPTELHKEFYNLLEEDLYQLYTKNFFNEKNGLIQ